MQAAAPAGALAGVKIIDLSRVLGGPFCTQCLGDHGAEVIKIEPPQGDETRLWGPPFGEGTSSYFEGVNRNKLGGAFDLRQPEARDVLLRLLADADVLIHNFKSGTMERWGLGYDAVLSRRFPRLIYCHVSGFGEDGPLGALPGYDAVVQAMSGTMSINGMPETGPLRMGVPIVDIGTGLTAVIAILMAVIERSRSGPGQKLDVSLYDCAISMLHPHVANTLMSGTAPRQTGNAHPNISPYDLYRTSCGTIFLAVGNNRQFAELCEVVGCPELAKDARFASNGDRVRNRVPLKTELEALLAAHNAAALADYLLRRGVPAGAVIDIPTMLAAPHTRHREMLIDVPPYRGSGIPIKMSRTAGSVRRPPPVLGGDTRTICRAAGLTDSQIDALVTRGIILAPTESEA